MDYPPLNVVDQESNIFSYYGMIFNVFHGNYECNQRYDDGKLSKHLCDLTPSPSTTTLFKYKEPNHIKIQYPFGNPKFIGMIAGGTNISSY